MNGAHLDLFARKLTESSSRRTFSRFLTGVGLTGVVGLRLGLAEGEARKKRRKRRRSRKKKPGRTLCEASCASDCDLCLIKTDGTPLCGSSSSITSNCVITCVTDSDCAGSDIPAPHCVPKSQHAAAGFGCPGEEARCVDLGPCGS